MTIMESIIVIIFWVSLIIMCFLIPLMFDNSLNTERILTNKGYTNIETTGYDFFVCGEDDFYSTGFIGTNSAGNRETGTLCCGLFMKGCTIRNG